MSQSPPHARLRQHPLRLIINFFKASCHFFGAIESQVAFSRRRFQIDTVSRFRKRVETDVISRSQIDQFLIRQGFRRHRVNERRNRV